MRNPPDSVTLRNEHLLKRIKDIKAEHPFWGYRRVWAYLRYIDGLITEAGIFASSHVHNYFEKLYPDMV